MVRFRVYLGFRVRFGVYTGFGLGLIRVYKVQFRPVSICCWFGAIFGLGSLCPGYYHVGLFYRESQSFGLGFGSRSTSDEDRAVCCCVAQGKLPTESLGLAGLYSGAGLG